MTTTTAPRTARKAITTLKVFRNGRYPEASNHAFLAEEANRLAAYSVKSWHFAAPITAVPAAGGASRVRWRAFIHTSTHCKFIYVRSLAMPSNNTGQPYSTVTFTVPGAGAPMAQAIHQYGGSTDDDTVDTIDVGQAWTIDSISRIDLDPDTDYEVQVQDIDNARTLAVSIFEYALPLDTANGYVDTSITAGQDILDAHRANLIPQLRNTWKRSAAPLITWSADQDSDAYVNTGTRNIIDNSTTVSAATPGWTIDCRHRSTLRRSADGVPVIMRAYAKTAATTGAVYLKDSGGTILATCALSSATASWVSSGAFYLPATLAKYDIHGAVLTGIGNTTVYAVSLYQLD